MNGLHGLETGVGIKRERLGFALMLTALEVSIFFGFILMGVIAPATLAVPIANGWTTTWAFAAGIGIVIVSVLLTGLYVRVENDNSV
jgi:uncharacterized membrane protein (DUF485 family)